MRVRAFACTILLAVPPLAAQQLAPPATGGVVALDQALGRLDQNKRVLMIAAHPDDESNELLTLLSRGLGADVAYLSLSRGEGGQNLIGPELGEELGLIRTGELMAARSIDGGRQYFTRAFDFGFSKTLEETLRFWPRDTIMADVLRVMRRFRPQIIVATFSGTARDGHGQHQMSGLIARQVFDLLRDSAWGPVKFYRSSPFDTSGTTVVLASGMLDPVTGRSITQTAAIGRSQHRSQDMGQVQRLGTNVVRLTKAGDRRGAGAADAGLFDGIDTSLERGMERYALLIDSARRTLSPRATERIVPILRDALVELRRNGSPFRRSQREMMLQEAIATAAGIVVDAVADDRFVAVGEQLGISISVWRAGSVPVRMDSMAVLLPERWTALPNLSDTIVNGVRTRRFSVRPQEDARETTPYFLRRARIRGTYWWRDVPDTLLGEALDPPMLRAQVRLDLDGIPLQLVREVSWRFNDQASGEVRKPVVSVPPISISLTPSILLWPAGDRTPRTVSVDLVHGLRDSTTAVIMLNGPGWPRIPTQRVTLAGEGARTSLRFTIEPPETMQPGRQDFVALVCSTDACRLGTTSNMASTTIDYPHIRPVTVTHGNMLRVEVAPLAVPLVGTVGYIRGASDMVPEALQLAGMSIEVLAGEALTHADLSRYRVIVIGPRAYETEPALVASNARLLGWVRGGGRLIVQYQQYQYIQGRFAPYSLTIARPHDRVTDEEALMTILDPAHPLWSRPNRIGPADWDGWVQERGLYFAHDWDTANWRTFIATGDNEAENFRGGLLAARLGNGLYVYTGLSFFRQLPAAVPGAFRLFANLIALEPDDVR